MSVRDVTPAVLLESLRRGLTSRVGDDLMASTAEQLRAEGRAEEARKILGRQLEMKFGPLSASARDRIASAAITDLESWADRFVSASSLEDVLGDR
jgi:hypothetical protein